MKLTTLLPLAVLSTAFVVPDEVMTNQIVVESQESTSVFDKLPSKDDILSSVKNVFEDTVAVGENAIDKAVAAVDVATEHAKDKFECYKSMTGFDANGWLESGQSLFGDAEDLADDLTERPRRPPHHKKPHHHHKPNQTVYELIASSKYTTKLAHLINKFPDLVNALNGTQFNYTIFAPTDKAFEKIPKDRKDISDEVIYKALLYHVSPEFYPAGRVLASHTIPTMRIEIGNEPQRLRVGLGLKGLAVNFYSRIVAVNIFGTNGVIHGVDSLILPPPSIAKIITLVPGEFSTLELALIKTGLFDVLKDYPHVGGTFFAPSNFAFKKLGPKINAFLFSKYGEKYLKGLLKYHLVANQTLYSDAFYNKASEDSTSEVDEQGIPKGRFHLDLPTALKGKSLSIDIVRFGGLIDIRINGYNRVAIQDGIAKDGVIQVVADVLIPPKKPGVAAEEIKDDNISIEELKERLSPYVKKSSFWDL